jgi:glycosyltransferase involved in cell wall biosynthesis
MRGRDALFVLVGDGSQRAELEARARGLSNVRFLPLQPEEGFADLLNAADVLLLNQRSTVRDMSLPGKLTSYFAAGRPVIAAVASDSETAREVTAANAGLVVEPERPQALADAIERLASMPAADVERLGASGAAFARANLTAQAGLRSLCDLVDAVAGRRPAALTTNER